MLNLRWNNSQKKIKKILKKITHPRKNPAYYICRQRCKPASAGWGLRLACKKHKINNEGYSEERCEEHLNRETWPLAAAQQRGEYSSERKNDRFGGLGGSPAIFG